jgi:predicted deacylase
MVIEAGGRGDRDARSIALTYNALQNALRHLGMLSGNVVPWAARPVLLEQGLLVKSTELGLFEPEVVAGDWIEKDSVFGRVHDFDGTLLEEILSPGTGTVLTVISARAIAANGFAGKVGVVATNG